MCLIMPHLCGLCPVRDRGLLWKFGELYLEKKFDEGWLLRRSWMVHCGIIKSKTVLEEMNMFFRTIGRVLIAISLILALMAVLCFARVLQLWGTTQWVLISILAGVLAIYANLESRK
jgi:hypothetical protein